VKPPILCSFGDIALAIGPKFQPYFDICMTILQQACAMRAQEDDYDMIEYVNQLREGIFEAYTGIIQGMKNGMWLLPHFFALTKISESSFLFFFFFFFFSFLLFFISASSPEDFPPHATIDGLHWRGVSRPREI